MKNPKIDNQTHKIMSQPGTTKTARPAIPPWLWLTLILLLALFLRLAGIWRAEPINYHPDEWVIANPVFAMANEGQFGLKTHYKWPACGLIHPVGYGLWALKPVFGPYSYNEILIILRLLSTLASVATVLVSFILVRKLFSRRAAMLSALLLAIAALPVILSHYGTTNGFVTLIILTVMWLSYELFEIKPQQDSVKLRLGRCCILGLLCGWGIAIKWTILLAAIPIAMALLLSIIARRKLGHWRRFAEVNLKRIAVTGGMTLLTFLAFLPDLQIAPQKVISGFEYEMKHNKTGHYGAVTTDQAKWDK